MPKFYEGFADEVAVPAGKRDVQVFDDELPGFGIRKFSSGQVAYFVKYNIGPQQRRHTLEWLPQSCRLPRISALESR
jgi:hypothetical protein